MLLMEELASRAVVLMDCIAELLLYASRVLFEWFFREEPAIDPETGAYVYDALQVQIDRSCSGLEFFVYTTLLVGGLSYWRFGAKGLLWWPLVSVSLSVMANGFRLIASVYVQELGDWFLEPGPHWRLHEWLGYLVFGGVWLLLVLMATKAPLTSTIAPGGDAAAPVRDGRVEKRQAKRPQKLCRAHFSTDQTNGTIAEHPEVRPNTNNHINS
jgi:exosortase/archaeosortase family protein